MAKFAPVVGIKLAEQLHAHCLYGDYHLVLAHHVLEYPERYRALFATMRTQYERLKRPFHVMLDNSLIELEFALRAADLAKAAEVVQADEIILPDVPADLEETIRLSHIAFAELPESVTKVGVIQGYDEQEIRLCVTAYADLGITVMALPRSLVTRSTLRSRVKVLDLLVDHFGYDDMPAIHLLGFSREFADDVEAAQRVRGIDSAIPIRLAAERHSMDPRWVDTRPKRDFDYLDWDPLDSPGQMLVNLIHTRALMRGGITLEQPALTTDN